MSISGRLIYDLETTFTCHPSHDLAPLFLKGSAHRRRVETTEGGEKSL